MNGQQYSFGLLAGGSTIMSHRNDSPTVQSPLSLMGDGVVVKKESIDSLFDVPSAGGGGDVQSDEMGGLMPQLLPVNMPKVIARRRPYLRTARSSAETCVCEVCQGELGRFDALLQHKLLHFNTTHVCYACDSYFVTLESLLLHITGSHRDILGAYPKGDAFICLVCVQRFSSSKSLLRHHAQHTDGAPANEYSCAICAIQFSGYRALLAHLDGSKHKDMKVRMQSIFICIDCRSVFASRDSYAFHMMMRAQNETCDASSTTSKSLIPRQQQSPSKYSSATTATRHDSASRINSSGSSPSPPGELSRSQRRIALGQGDHGEEEDGQSRVFPSPLNLSTTSLLLEHRHLMTTQDAVPNEDEDGVGELLDIRRKVESDHFVATAALVERMESNQERRKPIRTSASPTLFDRAAKLTNGSPRSDRQMHGLRSASNFFPMELMLEESSSKPGTIPLSGGSRRLDVNSIKWHLSEALTEKEQQRVCRWLREGGSAGDSDHGEDDTSNLTETERGGIIDNTDSGSDAYRWTKNHKYITGCRLPVHDLISGKEFECRITKRSLYDDNSVVECPDERTNTNAVSKRSQSAQETGLTVHRAVLSAQESSEMLRRCRSADYDSLQFQRQIDSNEPRSIEIETVNHGACPSYDSLSRRKRSTADSYWNERNSEVQKRAAALDESVNSGTTSVTNNQSVSVDRSTLMKSGSIYWNNDEKKSANKSNGQELQLDSQKHQQLQQLDLQKHELQRKQLNQLLQNSARLRRGRSESNVTNSTPEYNAVLSDKNYLKFSNGWKETVNSNGGPMDAGILLAENGQDDSAYRAEDDQCKQFANSERDNQVGSAVAGRKSSSRRDNHDAAASTAYGDDVSTSGRFDLEHGEGREPRSLATNQRTSKEVFAYVVDNQDKLMMCRFCHVIYTDQILYYLHMGLHNHNSPWQCNLCGVTCAGVQDFTSHVIHYN